MFFYSSFFFSVVGFFSLILFFVHKQLARIPLPMFRYVQKAFREAIVLSAFITLALYLQGKYWLNLWNGTVLILLFILYISYSLSVRNHKQVDTLENNIL